MYFSVIELQKVSKWKKFGNCFAVFDKKYHLVQHNNLIILVALKPQIRILVAKHPKQKFYLSNLRKDDYYEK